LEIIAKQKSICLTHKNNFFWQITFIINQLIGCQTKLTSALVTINNGNNTTNGMSTNSVPMVHPREPIRMRSFSMSSTGSGGSSDGTSPPISTVGDGSPNMKKYFFGDMNTGKRERHSSGSIFSRRADYSSFNTLPRHKINSYHIKMEDNGNNVNDETRCFILSTLSANKMNRLVINQFVSFDLSLYGFGFFPLTSFHLF